VFQVVLSQRFEVPPTSTRSTLLPGAAARRNPSPYMYLLRFAAARRPYDVVGSSPRPW
jgi:anthranilate synthase component 1